MTNAIRTFIINLKRRTDRKEHILKEFHGRPEFDLSYISKIASDSGYFAIVKLANGLKTNQNKTIQYKNGLKADAIVIIKT